jgi:hypothetical protein
MGRKKRQEVLNRSPCQVGDRTEWLEQSSGLILVFQDQPQVLNGVRVFSSYEDDEASLRTHKRMGMLEMAEFRFNGFDFAVLSYIG